MDNSEPRSNNKTTCRQSEMRNVNLTCCHLSDLPVRLHTCFACVCWCLSCAFLDFVWKMRIKRLKRASKRLSYYKNCFNFHPPYQIIIDGTISQVALKNKINLQEQMPKYLGDEVKMFSTACVITELDKLGK